MPRTLEVNRVARREEYHANPAVRQQQRQWQLNNPIAYKAIQERSRIKNRLRRQIDPAYKAHLADMRRQWRAKRPPKLRLSQREYRRRWREKLREDVLRHYGQEHLACIICGFADHRALTIDHINDNGAEERKAGRYTTGHFYEWLRSSDFPSGYQTLCGNCQFIKEWERKQKNRLAPDEFLPKRQ